MPDRPTCLSSTLFAVAVALLGTPVVLAEEAPHPARCAHRLLNLEALAADGELFERSAIGGEDHSACIDGFAEGYPCSNVDLLGHFSPGDLGASTGNDIWGWTDPMTGAEIALMGLDNGTAFVDVSEPDHAVVLGFLPTHTSDSTWRDIKVYADHAFIVSEASEHGMQIFDLGQLRSVVSPPVTFSNTAHYGDFGNAHNIVINEDTGFAYAVGSDTCNGGLHFVDLSTPTSPTNSGCFSTDGYTHDAQCLTYAGPDTEHLGDEICFAANEDTLTVVDVTDKGAPVQLSRSPYAGTGYAHQGWTTEDHRYHLFDDEVDESTFGHTTRTYLWDIGDLENPSLTTFDSANTASDHNQYIRGDYAFQANYRSGLRIIDISDVANGNLAEVAFFDISPASDASGFSGAWSVYPYFDSGTVVVSGIGEGLFILRPALCSDPVSPTELSAQGTADHTIELSWTGGVPGGSFNVYRSFGTCPGGSFERVASGVTTGSFVDTVSGQVDYAYTVTAVEETGLCESAVSACSSASTTGECNAPPIFEGISGVTNLQDPSCRIELTWNPATANCGGGVTYSIYRSTDPAFVPGPEHRIADGVATSPWGDTTASDATSWYYVVRATDLANDSEDANLVRLEGRATGPASDGTWASGAEVGDPGMTYSTGSSLTGGADDGGLATRHSRHIGWEPTGDQAHSGARSFFSTYANNQCSTMVTPPLQLTPAQSSELSFFSRWDIESGWDGGVVQITDDGGNSWTSLPLDQGYPGSFISSTDACGFSSGDPSFTGTQGTWTQYTADLSPWNGQEIRIRWIFSTDGFETGEGWFVDTVDVSHTQVAGACFAGLFRDGFESGDTTGWGSVAP